MNTDWGVSYRLPRAFSLIVTGKLEVRSFKSECRVATFTPPLTRLHWFDKTVVWGFCGGGGLSVYVSRPFKTLCLKKGLVCWGFHSSL